MSLESFVQAMPKVELDIQLEGAMRKETLLLIAEQNDIADNLKHFKQWVNLLDHPDYKRVGELTQTVSQWLQQPDDLTRVVYELGVSLAKQQVRYAEVTVNPLFYVDNGLTFEQFLSAINDGRSRVERGWKMHMAWVLSVNRDQVRRVDDVLRWATSATAKKSGVVGIALMGREDLQPTSQFERSFRTAQKKLLPRVAQAGDVLEAEGILDVIQQLQPERIVDGWGTVDAPDVIALLTENHTALNIGLAKALCHGKVEQYAAYPLRLLYDEGITVTLGTHMPNIYKTTLTDEYMAVVNHCGFAPEEIEEIGLNAVRASLLADEDKEMMLRSFEEEYGQLRAEHLSA